MWMEYIITWLAFLLICALGVFGIVILLSLSLVLGFFAWTCVQGMRGKLD